MLSPEQDQDLAYFAMHLANHPEGSKLLASVLKSSAGSKVHLSKFCVGEVVRIRSIIICHLSKLWKDKFFILYGVIFLERLEGKFEIDRSWE